jgi:ubiquinone/menaquinone biosynthesis C-methylase UbiE
MLGLTATEVRSSPWSILGRWLAKRLPRWRRAAVDDIGVSNIALPVLPSRTRVSRVAQEPLLDPIVLRQWIYGPGNAIPGDAAYFKELMSPVGLKPEMTLLDLSAGMGGAGVTINKAWKSYIAGFDRNPDLVQAGAAFLRKQKAGRHVQLAGYDPENFELRAGFYDCVMAREVISTLVDKEAFFHAASLGLKSFGQIVITDFVRGDAPASDPSLAGWAAMQEHKPLLWPSEHYAACLARLGCNVLIAMDTTAAYRGLLLRSWRNFLDHPELHQLRGRRALPLLGEVERCIRTLAALDSGALRYFYICAQSTRSTAPIR